MKISRKYQVIFGISLISMIVFGSTTLLKNQSNCLPHAYFLMYPSSSYHKGEFVVFDHPVFKKTCVKRLVGKEGDEVQIRHQKVWMNGKEIGPIALNHNKGKTALTPLPSQVIPKGYVFLAGDHPKSFDSRYAEVGLVPVDKIQGKAIGFWKRSKGE